MIDVLAGAANNPHPNYEALATEYNKRAMRSILDHSTGFRGIMQAEDMQKQAQQLGQRSISNANACAHGAAAMDVGNISDGKRLTN